ncbi:MAG: hypothetical protein M3Q65_08520, partial [Chloroflexota bacterium]|nr:hypothetical protein [Chloroflexota bacterium]
RIGADLAACGVDTLTLGTDEDLLPALVHFLGARRARRRAGGQGGSRAVTYGWRDGRSPGPVRLPDCPTARLPDSHPGGLR